ncbi:ABC-type amino acid transport substrate-binding protein [Agrobacterium tumefaciens]|uniref:ABC-type amino acid transport substrate-binding protein n=1 Tax=Agrobacterium radiobacter TaxID=362 RepID=A0ABR6JCG6_AGRRD|nr:transporter substrate-binding domain-containing protein [Agrobacterium radiobacter]MBB4320448.1 ABC-type amino acid transport substrate-binding protein [Agrobacterium radiobacter]MBB4337113.1 ABC-type amino acid transport substrate-binding protein [Agrobacterium radiobacter]MBB4492639.1 ABC-type amino acid transport substrate-binding protein [Agrobacterium radiobacter]MBB4497537.1 ABC-type amino acid transport substrate-binding protein [Agrobacterium radiobacter]MBB4502552.1 ABC-type amino 
MKLNHVFSALTIFAAVCLPLAPVHADDLQKIEKAGKLSVALSGAFPPFSFVDGNNKVVGFDVDVGREIAKRMKVEPAFVTTAWDGIIAGLVTGRYDTIIGSMSITDERKKAVDFVGPYYRSGLAVFVKKGAGVDNVDALEGKAIGVTLGEAAEKWAREQNKFEIRTYKGLPEMLLDLNAGRVDAIVADDVPVFVAIAKSNAPVEQVKDDRMPRYDIGMAIRKGNPELAATMQKALNDMMKDGTYETISKKWIGQDIR